MFRLSVTSDKPFKYVSIRLSMNIRRFYKSLKKVVIKLRNANNVNSMSLSAQFKLNKDNLNKTNFNKGFLIIGGL